ncbi:peptidylprolyl isomerase [Sinisalibacter aestuarii]|uniref:Parvulin-like PPIase n=1 Tax=Sinisalibacter aestuarii TaxID=2949426 RepID=A0ABQ5LP44_9RHOB|nr:peptidylprolyl isomerase [Sinisalibacter aestuarii]GKY86418.1 peptidylprolyl isomerase [Sinisalibacter aestuarii]
MKTLALRSTLLAGAALSLFLAAPLRAQDAETTEAAPEASEYMAVDANTVLATVNGEDITVGHIVAARLALPEQYQALPNEVLLEGLIEQLIQQTVLGQAMGEMTNRAQIQLDNERRAITATEKLDSVLSEAVDDAKIQAAYDAEYANAEPTKEWNASHILVETEEEAADLIVKLEDGADFAELAQEFSTGPSGPSGGELGWFSAGMMVQPFEEAVTGMDDGAVAGPVQTQFGWHVIKLNESRMKGAPALEEVQGDIISKLENDAVEQALATLLDAATIERTDLTKVDPAVLGDPAILD